MPPFPGAQNRPGQTWGLASERNGKARAPDPHSPMTRTFMGTPSTTWDAVRHAQPAWHRPIKRRGGPQEAAP